MFQQQDAATIQNAYFKYNSTNKLNMNLLQNAFFVAVAALHSLSWSIFFQT